MIINSIRLRSFRAHKLFSTVLIALAFPLPPASALPALTFQAQSPTPPQPSQPSASHPSASQQPANQTDLASTAAEANLSPEEYGDLQMVRKRYQLALQSYMQITPKTAQIWNKIGIADQQLFMTEDAKKSYQNSLKLNSKNADVMNNLGSVYYSLKQYAIAEHWYRKALKVKPKSPLIYKNLGTDLLAEDKFQKGWDCYQAALSIDPEVFERQNLLRIGEPTPTLKRGAMNFYLAKSYARVGKPDLAVEYLRMAIDEGFTDRKKILADKEFASLYKVSAFQQLLSEQSRQ